MRAPKRKRELKREIGPVRDKSLLKKTAERVNYVGSSEHKSEPGVIRQSRPRADASLCPTELHTKRGFTKITKWLRDAVSRGNVGHYWEGNFPRYVWYRDGETVYEARLTNREKGEYKGYPLEESEWPEGL